MATRCDPTYQPKGSGSPGGLRGRVSWPRRSTGGCVARPPRGGGCRLTVAPCGFLKSRRDAADTPVDGSWSR